jgi:pantoate--beta-alanine ligase
MGALHRGHAALMIEARRRCGLVVVSIFVNPSQFGPNEDFARYPRTLQADRELCESAGVDLLFVPEVGEMYPPGDQTRVRVGRLADPLCGEHRPGHFEGVATVVAKLFALIGPAAAFFGRKDYQQLRVVERMARDLLFPVEIVGCPTVREPDGLALSSRNVYLSAQERAQARSIPRALAEAARSFAQGERRSGAILERTQGAVGPVATSIDYVSLADPVSLEPIAAGQTMGDKALLAIALRIGRTRLIDNLVLGEDPPPTVTAEEP